MPVENHKRFFERFNYVEFFQGCEKFLEIS